MVRIVGAGMLLGASAALGFGAAGALKARVRELELLVLSLELMERELSARLLPLSELMSRAAQGVSGNVKSFYLLCEQGLERQRERSFSQIWQEAAEAAQLRIAEEDRQLLDSLGGVLGRYDCASQCGALAETRERLMGVLQEARTQRDELGRVYRTLGVAAGALLSIILL